MSNQTCCMRCHSPLPFDAPEGLCPRCLMSLGMNPSSAEMDSDFFEIQAIQEADISLAPLMKPLPEQVLPKDLGIHEAPGRYAHLGEYSRGGMGRILLVHDQTIGRQVALKELFPESEAGGEESSVQRSAAMVARFLREAQLTGQLEHPSIVPVYEMGQRDDGTLYYTMKLVRGKTLYDALSEKNSPGERLKLLPHVVDLCQAIAYAHSRGVIHRDLKPRNVMIGEFGETVVIDWGLAKAQSGDHDTECAGADSTMTEGVQALVNTASPYHTMDGTVLGTAAYMSPEQASGDVESVDERSDVYSLGAVLYEVLTGRPPFTGMTAIDVLDKVVHERPAPVLKVERRVPPRLAAICERAMARAPAKRYASARELADDIQAFISGQVFREREARLSFVAAFYIFSAAFLAAGAALLAYQYWEVIPPSIKVVLLAITVVILYVFGVVFGKKIIRKSLRAEAMKTLGTLMLGASIFLIADTFDLNGLFRDGFGWWAIAAIIAAYAGLGNLNAIIALAMASVWFFQRAQDLTPAALWWFPFLPAAVVLPLAYARESRMVFTGTLLLIGASTAYITFDHGSFLRPSLAVLACTALFFPWGLLSQQSDRWHIFARPAITLATTVLAAMVLALGIMQAPQYLIMEYTPGRMFDTFQLLPLIIVCAMALMLWSLAAVHRFVLSELRILSLAFLLSGLLLLTSMICAGFIVNTGENAITTMHWLSFVMAYIAAAVLGIGTAWTGVALVDRRTFLLGTLYNVIAAVHCAIQTQATLQVKAGILIAIGFIVLFTGIRFESFLKKRRLV